MGLCQIMPIHRAKSATLLASAAIAALAFAAACGKTSADHVGGGAPPAMPVQVRVAQLEKIPETTEYLSIVKSRHSANINPQVEGLRQVRRPRNRRHAAAAN
jgi:multidrug efflux pump subunit AcrA (membrane-fusion protein)